MVSILTEQPDDFLNTFVLNHNVISRIKAAWNSGKNIVITGPQGRGKTALLRYLCMGEGSFLNDKSKFVYINYKDILFQDEKYFQDTLAKAIGYNFDPEKNPDHLHNTLSRSELTLCIDDYEDGKLTEKYWSALSKSLALFRLIIASRYHPSIDSGKFSPLLADFLTIELGPFTSEESHQLINLITSKTNAKINDEQVDRIIERAGGQPRRLRELIQEALLRQSEEPVRKQVKSKQTNKDQAATEEARSEQAKSERSGSEQAKSGNYSADTSFTSDSPSEVDCIWGGVYIKALVDFIRHKDTKPPLVIGINAPWGAGKTSLMKSIQAQIDSGAIAHNGGRSEPRMSLATLLKYLRGASVHNVSVESLPGISVPTVWFNAWKYSKEEQLWAALMQNIIIQLTDRMDTVEREAFLLSLNLKRIDKDKIRTEVYQTVLSELALRMFGLFIIAVVGFLYFYFVGIQSWFAPAMFSSLGIVYLLELARKIRGTFTKPLTIKLSDYIKQPKYEEKMGFLNEVEADFKRLQELLKFEKLIVFIDDLDRCSMGKIVEVIEAINVFFGSDHVKCIFVLGTDFELISTSLECHYDKLVKGLQSKYVNNGIQYFGMNFLQKIIQVSLTLPEPKEDQLRAYLRTIINPSSKREREKSDQQKTNERQQLKEILRSKTQDITEISAVADALRDETPSAGADIDKATQEVAIEMLTEQDPKVREVLEEAVQYLDRRPRQIKRFLNLFRLTVILNIRQGLPLSKDDYQRLAKLVAISMRYPAISKLLNEDNRLLLDMENASTSDEAWSKLNTMPRFNNLLNDDLRMVMNSGVRLSEAGRSFALFI